MSRTHDTIKSGYTVPLRSGASSPSRLCYSPKGGSMGNATTKLEATQGKFTGLYTDLESEKNHKRMTEQERYAHLKESINVLERSFKAEVTRRHDAERHLQSHVDSELSQVSEQISGQLKELQQTVRSGLDQMQRAISNLNNLVMDEREQRKVDIDHVGTSLCARLDEVVQTVDEERFSRLEQERQSLKRIGEDLFKVNERIECEKKCREHAIAELASEVHEFEQNKRAQEGQFQTRMAEEIGMLRDRLNVETTERMQEDETIVTAINEYTRALQEGLRIVGST
eukprot:jgi/Ulvmu1/11239/UM073_0011.1